MRLVPSKLLLGFLLLAPLACDEPVEPVRVAKGKKVAAAKASLPPAPLKADTVLPTAFDAVLPPEKDARTVVPAGMLLVSRVARPRAELRTGPGTQFELTDTVLPKGTKLLVFSRVGVWQKVLVLDTWKSGWVHSGAIDAAAPNPQSLVVAMQKLPTVLVMHEVDSVQAFKDAAPLKVKVPRGALFRSLRIAETGTLVWLPQTNSVMWMSRKDVQ